MRQNLFSSVIAIISGAILGYHFTGNAVTLGPFWEVNAVTSRQPAALRTDRRSKKVVPITLESGLEGKILHPERIRGKDYVYVHFINGPYLGKRGWMPIGQNKGSVRLYAVASHQAYQTLELENATFARTTENVEGLLNLDFEAEDLDNWEFLQKEYTVNFFDRYPRTELTQLNPVSEDHWNTSCPNRPIRKSGVACDLPPKRYDLPSWLLQDIKRAAKKHNVHPAIVAAIIQKESYFNPFSENQYEKKLCQASKRTGDACAAYKWGQGLSQLGATNSATHGLRWLPSMRRPAVCKRSRHIFKRSCYNYLVKHCAAQKKKTGLADAYCPRESISAVAQYVSELINTKHELRVDVRDADGKWSEKIIDVKEHMHRVLAEEFRYIVGMYNRGKRPINSIEEHYRQYGKAPQWYDDAWTTKRIDGITPSPDIGYMILYKESINRCHVWQIAGLCGLSLGDTLAGQYLELFPNWPTRNPTKPRVIASDNSGER